MQLGVKMDIRFSRSNFEAASREERAQLCSALRNEVQARMGAVGMDAAVQFVLTALRELGHEFWSFDESSDFEIWGPDYTKPPSKGLYIDFRGDKSSVDWIGD